MKISKDMDGETFRSYYFLKEELVAFCREYGLPTSGGKIELTERITHFLDTGEIPQPKNTVRNRVTVKTSNTVISRESVIEDNFVCSEKHRAFFREEIGKGFSFNVSFQKWLKSNSGRTYGEAIEAYYQILEDKKKTKSTIDRQFEYNTYIRDFFADNKGKKLDDAIKCWKYKKSQKGHNKYENSDLVALLEHK